MKTYLSFKRLYAAVIIAALTHSYCACQTLLIENFNYTSGSLLTANGWNSHSGSGTNPVKVYNSGLTFTGYPSSNIGLSAVLSNTGEDVNKPFTTVISGSVYCAFMVRIDTIAEDYFLHLTGSPVGTNYKARVNVSGTGTALSFGLLKGTGTPVYTPVSSYTTGVTYLLVLKYSIIEGSKNDIVSLYIITGSLPSTEPATPSLGPFTDSSDDLTNVSAVALRQNSAQMDIVVDGIRVANNWSDAIGIATSTESINNESDIKIYPVPVIEELTIKNLIQGTEIDITDLSGRRVFSTISGFANELKINLSKLNSGVYLLSFRSEKYKKTLRIIKK